MSYVWNRWFADEFRAAGLTVVEIEGWKNRGRPASTGNFDPRGPVTNHHTGVHSSAGDPGPTLRTLISGRPDLPGPLCHWTVRYDGAVVMVAAGRANHAGKVGTTGMPLGADGNALALGDEIDTDGRQIMPLAQRHAVDLTNAVALAHFKASPMMLHRHQDISGTGKWDLGSVTTGDLRKAAEREMSALTQEDDMTPAQEKLLTQLVADVKVIKDLSRRELARGQVNTRAILAASTDSDEDFAKVHALIKALDKADEAAAK